MIETKSAFHTVRLFATSLCWTDLVRVVLYCNYLGDKNSIPWYYFVEKGHSCQTDLTQSLEDLMAGMKSNTRNEIRRAIKEGCSFDVVSDVDEFIPFYNSFCKAKGLNDCVDRPRLLKYKNLLVTKSLHQGNALAMHANLLDPESHTALLILSCSQRLDAGVDKKMIGWGNRFLHYKDLEYLKSKGYTLYDWSGVCLDPNDERYSIGQFKLAFGGKIVDGWSLESPLHHVFSRFSGLLSSLRRK